MASFPKNQQTDLASILRALASHAPPPVTNTPPANFGHGFVLPNTNQSVYQGSSINHDGATTRTTQQPGLTNEQYDPSGYGRPDTAHFQGNTRTATPTTITDPHSITTWPPALRHVSKLLARNEVIADRIRKLVKSQHDHEKQWVKGREALVQLQENRVDGRSKVADVLRAVGGHIDPNVTGPTKEEDLAELARYDAKVYRACTEMAKAMKAELIELGIPFFGTKAALIDHGSDTAPILSGDSPVQVSGDLGLVTKEGLALLQKQMLDLLENLSKD